MNGAVKKMLTGDDIKTMCDVYHGSIEDFEKAILVERIAYPFIVNG